MTALATPAATLPPPSAPRRSLSILSAYLRDCGAHRLLTADEERDLARAIRRGSKEARDALIKHNLRLVVSITRRFEGLGLPLTDLIGEGNRGLIRATQDFDPDKGRFSTHATWWIRNYIHGALDEQPSVVRAPAYAIDKYRKMADEEIEKLPRRKQRIAKATRAALRSLAGGNGGEGAGARRYLEERAAPPPGNEPAADVRDILTTALAELTRDERDLLAARYGMGQEKKTLQQIADRRGLTRERIRQIQMQAEAKLREAIEARGIGAEDLLG